MNAKQRINKKTKDKIKDLKEELTEMKEHLKTSKSLGYKSYVVELEQKIIPLLKSDIEYRKTLIMK